MVTAMGTQGDRGDALWMGGYCVCVRTTETFCPDDQEYDPELQVRGGVGGYGVADGVEGEDLEGQRSEDGAGLGGLYEGDGGIPSSVFGFGSSWEHEAGY